MTVKIEFEEIVNGTLYRDAFYFKDDQVPSAEQLETLKQERINNWLAVIESASNAEYVEEPNES